jgi:hypothetical protein
VCQTGEDIVRGTPSLGRFAQKLQPAVTGSTTICGINNYERDEVRISPCVG